MKYIVVLFLICSCNALANSAMTFSNVSGVGHGQSFEQASRAAYNHAKSLAILQQPSTVYVHSVMSNVGASSDVIQIPAQIVAAEVLSVETKVTPPSDSSEEYVIKDGVKHRVDTDDFGNAIGTLYQVEATFRFTILPSSSVDRAKFLHEHQTLKNILSGNQILQQPVLLDSEYGEVADLLIEKAKLVGKAATAAPIADLGHMKNAVAHYQDNYLAALTNTYSPSVMAVDKLALPKAIDLKSGFYSGDWAGVPMTNYWQIELSLFSDCMNTYKDALSPKPLVYSRPGNLCDLFRTLPVEVRRSILRHGSQASNHELESSWINPLQPTGLVIPTVSANDQIPIGYGLTLSGGNVENIGAEYAAMDHYVEFDSSVLPGLLLPAIVGKPQVFATVMFTDSAQYIDVPITSNQYIASSKLYLLVDETQINSKSLDVEKSSIKVVLWWSGNMQHPAPSGWQNIDGDLHYPATAARPSNNTILNFAKNLRSHLSSGEINEASSMGSSTFTHLGYAVRSSLRKGVLRNHVRGHSQNDVSNPEGYIQSLYPNGSTIVFLLNGVDIANAPVVRDRKKMGILSPTGLLTPSGPNNPFNNVESCFAYNPKTLGITDCKLLLDVDWPYFLGASSHKASPRSLVEDIKKNTQLLPSSHGAHRDWKTHISEGSKVRYIW